MVLAKRHSDYNHISHLLPFTDIWSV